MKHDKYKGAAVALDQYKAFFDILVEMYEKPPELITYIPYVLFVMSKHPDQKNSIAGLITNCMRAQEIGYSFFECVEWEKFKDEVETHELSEGRTIQ